jgi:hypothetical protein
MEFSPIWATIAKIISKSRWLNCGEHTVYDWFKKSLLISIWNRILDKTRSIDSVFLLVTYCLAVLS